MVSYAGSGGGGSSGTPSPFYRSGIAPGTSSGAYVKARSSVPTVFRRSAPPAPRPAPRPSYSPPRYNPAPRSYAPQVGSPSSVGRTATGSVRPAAPPPRPAPPPAPPSVQTWLKGDSSYITQQSALARALSDYKKQMSGQQSQYEGQYGLNNTELKKQRETGFTDLENDYASRGLLQSGVYGKAYSDLENDYKRRQTDLDTARANFLANLQTGYGNFQTEQQTTAERARQEALARRAAKYNL